MQLDPRLRQDAQMSSTHFARCMRTGRGRGLEHENRHAKLQADFSQFDSESAEARPKST